MIRLVINNYLGKINIHLHGNAMPGFVRRFKEHVEYTWRPKEFIKDEKDIR